MAKRTAKEKPATGGHTRSSKTTPKKRPIQSYDHKDKQRVNNPPVGLVTPDTDPHVPTRKTYQYDPHLDPQLVWAGKAEHTSFEVPTVSLHVHERIDPRTIIEAVRKRNGNGAPSPHGRGQGEGKGRGEGVQLSLFEQPDLNPPLREAVEFYKHAHGWTNRLIAGDSLLVMNSLLEKEGLAGKVQMVYLDPPYGIKYGSNFQPFVNKRDVKDGSDEDLTQEPEMIRAFRDTWELGIHSYLTYLRDRLLFTRELLHESGSCFVQISDENLHRVRDLMDEVFGSKNFCGLIVFAKTSAFTSEVLSQTSDFLLWYARDKEKVKYRRLWRRRVERTQGGTYSWIETVDGTNRRLSTSESEIPSGARRFRADTIVSPGASAMGSRPISFEGSKYAPSPGSHWKASWEGMTRLVAAQRVVPTGKILAYKRFEDDFPYMPFSSVWDDTILGTFSDKMYVVQTSELTLRRCLLMATDPGDLVLDPTCGSGTTAYVAEQWGRCWITCDTSRVALALAKQRLMTPIFDYYELAHPDEGVGSGFKYKTVPHVTLKSIANNPEIREGMTREKIDAAITKYAEQETLYDQPGVDRKKVRVTGPFTVEAVPAPSVRPVDSGQWIVDSEDHTGHSPLTTNHFAASEPRRGETLRQDEWRGELLRCGIRGKSGQRIEFSRVEPLGGTRWLHADAEEKVDSGECIVDSGTKPASAKLTTNHSPLSTRIVISFGPEHAPLEQRQVAAALDEASHLVPKPKIVVFASFEFDPEAAKDIDETNWPGVTLLKIKMDNDLLVADLKKKQRTNDLFWMIGQPDVRVVSEEWLVDSDGRMVAPYELYQKLSGLDRLAEINGLDSDDLRFYAAVSDGGALRADIADEAGGGVDSRKHRGGAGAANDGGVSAVSGDRAGVTRRIGDARHLVEQLGLRDAGQRGAVVNRLRGDQQIVKRAAQFTVHSPLTTRHYSQVEVCGWDYFNPRTGIIESGGADKIAMWLLDTDYDGRSLYPRQVFFPMAGEKDGWARLARNLKAEIDEELIEAYRGTVSLPFEAGKHGRAAVKIVDDRGIESLKIVEVS